MPVNMLQSEFWMNSEGIDFFSGVDFLKFPYLSIRLYVLSSASNIWKVLEMDITEVSL